MAKPTEHDPQFSDLRNSHNAEYLERICWVPVKSSGRTSIAYVLDAVEWTWI